MSTAASNDDKICTKTLEHLEADRKFVVQSCVQLQQQRSNRTLVVNLTAGSERVDSHANDGLLGMNSMVPHRLVFELWEGLDDVVNKEWWVQAQGLSPPPTLQARHAHAWSVFGVHIKLFQFCFRILPRQVHGVDLALLDLAHFDRGVSRRPQLLGLRILLLE